MAKKKGERYKCDNCGLIVLVEDVCGCDDCDIVCCSAPMKQVAEAKPAVKPKPKTKAKAKPKPKAAKPKK